MKKIKKSEDFNDPMIPIDKKDLEELLDALSELFGAAFNQLLFDKPPTHEKISWSPDCPMGRAEAVLKKHGRNPTRFVEHLIERKP